MKKLQGKFIDFAIQYSVLQFGKFILKSGRISPYFFNAGNFNDGQALNVLGEAYAELYEAHNITTPHLFGPAYKGISLATATSIALARKNINATVTFNRKEAKDHGEGGMLVGATIKGATTIIDDVITRGTAFNEAKSLIEANGGKVQNLLLLLNRCERGATNKSTIQEVQDLGINVYAIIDVFDIVEYLKNNNQNQDAERILEYQREYAPL